MTMLQSAQRADERAWLTRYFEQYRTSLFHTDVFDQLLALRDRLLDVRSRGKKAIIAGNGGSAAIASHCAVDLTKTAGIRCTNFNEDDLITCLANDYGYDQWLVKALEYYADDGDLVILISSSGKSPNMVNAAHAARGKRLVVVTFTGFDEHNPLKTAGQLNFWVKSRLYNVIEMTHHIWLLAVCDLIAGVLEPSPTHQRTPEPARMRIS